MNKLVFAAVFGFLGITCVASDAMAQNAVENIGDFNYWFAQRFVKDGNNVCYAYSVPDKAVSSFLVVTDSAADNTDGIVNLESKSGLKQGVPVVISIDGKQTFKLRAVGNKAWLETDTDAALVQAFKKGNSAKVKYMNAKGDEVTEVYSLSGFTKAKAAIDKACGL